MMHNYQRPLPYLYNTSPYGIPAYNTVSYQPPPLDTNWYHTWPRVRTVLLSMTLLICSAAIIGLDIANIAIEGNKQNSTSKLGSGTGKVGAGIWSGSIFFVTAIIMFAIIFIRNKRVAATFVLLAVTLAFFFAVVLTGLIGNTVQNNLYITNHTDQEKLQDKLLITMLSLAIFTMILCMIFFTMYTTVFFSPATRQSTKR